ncbi:uncharacterized protein SCHCODRAFT_02607924 [Schizophyllum commune H4-8]|nr:uncharacterized protein SCHCODRAFT_02607924 [Schizophyllum commune H4-8]KAI5900448.1 hypothetical protein SCHCODRAFT_02607924 [Schizophyllum commune H4-8]
MVSLGTSTIGSMLGKRPREPEPEPQTEAEIVPLEDPPIVEAEPVDEPIIFDDEQAVSDESSNSTVLNTEDQESPVKKPRLDSLAPVRKPKVVDWRTKPLKPVPYKLKNGVKKYAEFRKEERRAPFKAHCPPSVYRAYETMLRDAHEICVLDSWTPEGTIFARDYHVLGQSGKVYTTHIGKRPHCNCPNFFLGNHCKHIIYVFIKFLNLPVSSYIWYQRGLTRRELCDAFANEPEKRFDASFRELAAYHWALRVDDQNVSKPDFNDLCAICWEPPTPDFPKSELRYCEACKKALHKDCFKSMVKGAMEIAEFLNYRNPLHSLACPHCAFSWLGPIEHPDLKGEALNKVVQKSVRIKVTKHGFTQLADVLKRKPTKRTKHYIRKRNAKYRRRYFDQQYYFGTARGPMPQIVRFRQLEKHLERRRQEELRRQEVIAAAQEAAAKVNVLSMQPASMRRKKGAQVKKPAAHTYDVSQAAEQKARLEVLATYQASLVAAPSAPKDVDASAEAGPSRLTMAAEA